MSTRRHPKSRAKRCERVRITRGHRTLWREVEGGWIGTGDSGAKYEVTPVIQRQKSPWWRKGKDKLVVVWQLTGTGIRPLLLASTGEAMEVADGREMRLEQRRSA